MRLESLLAAMLVAMWVSAGCLAAEASEEVPSPKPVPRMQAVPQPYDQVSFQRDGQEIARMHFGSSLRRPFVFPVIGPAGRSLTRMGHPHDLETHSHHNSVWISHADVNGVRFWEDRGKGRIAFRRVEAFEDAMDETYAITQSDWIDEASGSVVLHERRRTQALAMAGGEWMLIIDLQLEPPRQATFGKTPFGLIGVRMAKTIGTNDGGGMIRNSEGAVNEKAILWKHARWVDYSGPITPTASEGITLMDHPANPNQPTGFHVRGDGWMGASLTLENALTITAGKPLRVKYGLYVHAGQPSAVQINQQWEQFAKLSLLELPAKKK